MVDEAGGACSMHGRVGKFFQNFVCERRSHARPMHRWEDDIIMDIK
jgi:hypothetical protein